MNPVPKLFAKIFLLTSLPFGAIIALIDFAFNSKFNVLQLILATFFYGIFMASFLIIRQQKKLKEMGIQQLTDENTRVYQTKLVHSAYNLQEFTDALKADAFFVGMKIALSEKEVILKSTRTKDSWGEVISIQLVSEKDGSYEYKISSRPILRTTLLDYGKNLSNLTEIERILTGNRS